MIFNSSDPWAYLKAIKQLGGLASLAGKGISSGASLLGTSNAVTQGIGALAPYTSAVTGPLGIAISAKSGDLPGTLNSAASFGVTGADKLGLLAPTIAETAGEAGPAGSAAAGAAAGGVTPLAGLSAVLALPAAAALGSGIYNMSRQKEAAQRATWDKNKMGTSFNSLQQLSNLPEGGLKEYLDTPLWEGERTGDVLANVVRNNLQGRWFRNDVADAGERAPVSWTPDESLAPLKFGLEDLGYGTDNGRDPTALLRYSGGFTGSKDRWGIPDEPNTAEAIKNWESILNPLAEAFRMARPEYANRPLDMMPKDEMKNVLYNRVNGVGEKGSEPWLDLYATEATGGVGLDLGGAAEWAQNNQGMDTPTTRLTQEMNNELGLSDEELWRRANRYRGAQAVYGGASENGA